MTSDESVAEATAALLARKVQLVGIVNCAGVAFEGPCEVRFLNRFVFYESKRKQNNEMKLIFF